MKMIVITLVVTAGLLSSLAAQPPLSAKATRTNQLFNTGLNNAIQFDFDLGRRNKMKLELSNLHQVDSLPCVSRLMLKALENIEHAAKFDAPTHYAGRRIDFFVEDADTLLRIINYPLSDNVYVLQKTGATQVRMEQDTLRIRLYTREEANPAYYFICLFLNNLDDIKSLAAESIPELAIGLLKDDLRDEKNFKLAQAVNNHFYAAYNVQKHERTYPLKTSAICYDRPKLSITPYAQAGLQFIRGSLAVSAALGPDLIVHIDQWRSRHFRLLWEPYYFFGVNPEGKQRLEKDAFITFRYTNAYNYPGKEGHLGFSETFSVGWLASHKGDQFSKGSIKLSLPGLQSKNLSLEPEFIFHDFFRGIQPSLKLILSIK